MKFNFSKLRGRVIEKFGTIEAFVPHTGKSAAFVSQVFNGKSYLKQEDIKLWSALLDIEDVDIGSYFFVCSELT